MKLKLKLVRSVIGKPKDQKSTVQALGLRRLNHEIVKDVNPQVAGMIAKVKHLLAIEEV
jgi:large subunit ribosomal protein L30